MQLTTKVEYAIRALIELAIDNDGKPTTIKEICSRQNLPVKYMEQLFRKLKQNGLITSIKGASGGYILNIAPDKISLKRIMTAVDDELASLNCSNGKNLRDFCSGKPCSFYTVWQEIKADLDSYFENITLKRFLDTCSGNHSNH